MRVLGIDLSLSATGLAMISPEDDNEIYIGRTRLEEFIYFGGNRYFYRGALILPHSTNIFTRWNEILNPILEWCDFAQHIMIEGYAFSNQHAYVRSIAEIGGIVRYHLREKGKVPIEISPSSLKKFVTNDGRAKKETILAAVRESIPSIHDHNMADALGLAEIGWGIYGERMEFPKFQREALDRIKHPEEKTAKRKRNVVSLFEKLECKSPNQNILS